MRGRDGPRPEVVSLEAREVLAVQFPQSWAFFHASGGGFALDPIVFSSSVVPVLSLMHS